MPDWADDDYWAAVMAQANEDAEFRLHARFWTATVRLRIGRRNRRLRLQDGAVAAIEPWFGGLAANLAIGAPERDWQALLEPVPRPFYQDLYPATIHHQFDVIGDTASYCAYYPAIRRLIEIMREVRNA